MANQKEDTIVDDQPIWTIPTRLVKTLEVDDVLKPEDIAEWLELCSNNKEAFLDLYSKIDRSKTILEYPTFPTTYVADYFTDLTYNENEDGLYIAEIPISKNNDFVSEITCSRPFNLFFNGQIVKNKKGVVPLCCLQKKRQGCYTCRCNRCRYRYSSDANVQDTKGEIKRLLSIIIIRDG